MTDPGGDWRCHHANVVDAAAMLIRDAVRVQ